MTRALLLALALVGCIETKESLSRNGEYFKDSRTGLCFVYWTTWSKGSSRETVTNVPCTPEVLRLVGR